MARLPEDKLLTVHQVCDLIGFKETTIYSGRCHTNELLRIEFQNEGESRPTIRFSYNDVQQWIAKHKRRAEEKRATKTKPRKTIDRQAINAIARQHQLRVVK